MSPKVQPTCTCATESVTITPALSPPHVPSASRAPSGGTVEAPEHPAARRPANPRLPIFISDAEAQAHGDRVAVVLPAPHRPGNGEQGAAGALPPDARLPGLPIDRGHDGRASPRLGHRRREVLRHR